MMHVTWNNVNLGAATVSVRANEQHGFVPKTYEEREIPIPDSLVQMLQTWKTKSNQACPLVFPTKGCKPKNDFLDICKAIALRAGVNCGHCQNVLNGKAVRSGPAGDDSMVKSSSATIEVTQRISAGMGCS